MSEPDPFNAREWGPALWKLMHTMAAGYPAEPTPQFKASCRQFFYSLRHLLPCPTCRQHYTVLLSRRQPQVNSSEELQEWVLWLHNEVNQRLGQGRAWDLNTLKHHYPPLEGGKDLNEESPAPTPAPRVRQTAPVRPKVNPPPVLQQPVIRPPVKAVVGVPTSAPRAPAPINTPKKPTPRPASRRKLPKRRGIIKRRAILRTQQMNAIRQFGIPGAGINPKTMAPRKITPSAPVQKALQTQSREVGTTASYSTPTKPQATTQRYRNIPKRKKKKDCGCGK